MCAYVYMYVWRFPFNFEGVEDRLFTCTNEYLNPNISKIIYMYVFVCVRMYICMYGSFHSILKESKTAYLRVHMSTSIQILVRLCVCMYVYVYVCICMYMCVCVWKTAYLRVQMSASIKKY